MNYGQVKHLTYDTYAGEDACYAHVPKAKRAKDFSYKSSIGYLVGYTDENSYLLYIPLERKVSKPTVAVVFD